MANEVINRFTDIVEENQGEVPQSVLTKQAAIDEQQELASLFYHQWIDQEMWREFEEPTFPV